MNKELIGTKILCVDDSADILNILSVVLQSSGATVITSSSAEAAMELLEQHRFDVIISDLNMPPGMDGYDLAHALRKLEDDEPQRDVTPTVMVSGDSHVPSSKRQFADFQVYLGKPFDHTKLVHIVERLVEADGAAVDQGSLAAWEVKAAAPKLNESLAH